MTSKVDSKPARNSVPDIIKDTKGGKSYKKGRFLGKGGFAYCYEVTEMESMEVYACKVVSKTLLVKPHQKDKMTMEIIIHRELSHKHLVGFEHHFEDNDNVYIVLELCRRRSLMELQKRRRYITEPEARYFIKQIIQACVHLHSLGVIHRDLKLGNLFVSEELEVKIGDFGLAAQLDYEGERKRTICGTPNYIAPEVITKRGHSYEVDVWALGCIMFTLLCGRPPFETSSLRETYSKIQQNDYEIPKSRNLSPAACKMIKRMLQSDPKNRPTMATLLTDPWLKEGFLPVRLPSSCLTMAPRLERLEEANSARPPFVELQPGNLCRGGTVSPSKETKAPKREDEGKAFHVQELFRQIHNVVSSSKVTAGDCLGVDGEEEAEHPASIPIYWVAKWVDYSDKYGLGYQLCDNSMGVLFNDTTRLLLASNGDNIQYIERDGKEHFYSMKNCAEAPTKKVVLLKYFRNYMNEHLVKTGAHIKPREGDELTRLPFLRKWFRTRSAIVLLMSNGTLQINFFSDHTKIIICPLMQAVTYIDEHKVFRTFKLELLAKYGCKSGLMCRLKYAKTMVERIMQMRSDSVSSTKSTGTASGASASAVPAH
ncbi:serine/threonine-protein kinase PLK1-like [Watersipora subatra]|uniref:serine/threonine-protein kinase PLK1-like n=1 Tax=Watersipora subatra TaxID=2589382 RepID=UPI00355B2363